MQSFLLFYDVWKAPTVAGPAQEKIVDSGVQFLQGRAFQ